MGLFEEAGFPPGVVNVVTGLGSEVGAALVQHSLVKKIAFAGSDTTGRIVNELAAKQFKHVSLELERKSPNIVFRDANIDDAINAVVSGIFAAQPNPTMRRVHPVDHHKDPMAVQQDRLTTKQIDAPEAAIGSRKGSEPGRIRGARTIWPAALREDSAHDAVISLDGKYMRDLFGNASIVEILRYGVSSRPTLRRIVITSPATAADDHLVLEQQRFGDDGADPAGACELGQGGDQLRGEENQVTHRRCQAIGIPVSTRSPVCGVSRYDRRIRTSRVSLMRRTIQWP